ncbi:MAG: glycosyltransferase family 4 protein [Patescibacteria group bacterium]
MKIVYFVHCYPPAKGGLEYLSQQLVEMLADHEVVVITGQGETLDSYKTFSNFVPINRYEKNVIRLPIKKTQQKIANKLFGNLVRKFSIFSPWYFGPILSYSDKACDIIRSSDLIIAAGMPTRLFVDAACFAKKFHKKLVALPAYHNVSYYNGNYLFQKTLDLSSKILVLSEKEQRELKSTYKVSSGKIVHLSFSPYKLKDVDQQKRKIASVIKRRINNFSNKTFTIGYVGQITRRKNLELISNFFRKYKKIFSNKGVKLRLVLAGVKTNTYLEIQQEMRKSFSQTEFVYNFSTDEKAGVFQNIDVFINPSKEESLGIVNFEAIFHGCLVLSHEESPFNYSILKNDMAVSSENDIFAHIVRILDDPSMLEKIIYKQYDILDSYNFSKCAKVFLTSVQNC